jgi:hypothetical protein
MTKKPGTKWNLPHRCPHCKLHYDSFPSGPIAPGLPVVNYGVDMTAIYSFYDEADEILLEHKCDAPGGCGLTMRFRVVAREQFPDGDTVLAELESV